MNPSPQQRVERRMQTFLAECDRRGRGRPDGRRLRELHRRMVRAAQRAERKARD